MACLEFFADVVNGLQKPNPLVARCKGFYFRMSDRNFIAISIGFAKHDILGIRFDFFHHPVDALKPNQLQLSGFVFKRSHQSFLKSTPDNFKVGYFSFALNIGHQLIYLADFIKLSTILMPEGIILDEVSKG